MICKTHSLFLLLTIVAVVHTAPRRNRRSSVPAWHVPCGVALEPTTSPPLDIENYIKESLQYIKLQHQLALENYLTSDYEFLFERARLGVQKQQYIPNWIPGKKDVKAVKKLRSTNVGSIASHLPKFHTDLQKFAVAFEELIQDETDDKIQRVLTSTQSYLLMTLCEIETVLSTPPFQVPHRIHRSIMSQSERNPVDDTRRMVRDWGVLLKYKDYLHAWRHVFDY